MGEGTLICKDIIVIAADTIGWNKNTTYTVIKKTRSYYCNNSLLMISCVRNTYILYTFHNLSENNKNI